jgi:hypothetical protein
MLSQMNAVFWVPRVSARHSSHASMVSGSSDQVETRLRFFTMEIGEEVV